MDKVPKKEDCVSQLLLCCVLLDFLTLEAGTDRLSQNIGVELPFYVA